MYCTAPLDSSFNKKEFACGKEMLDNYLHLQANQDIKRKLAAIFILPDNNNYVKGYYTLSSDSIPRKILPENIINKLPKSYHNLPVTLIGRLAVDNTFQGKGYGELLLYDALKRCLHVSKNSIASMAVVVDPLDDESELFYQKYGFVKLRESGRMFLPMYVIEKLV